MSPRQTETVVHLESLALMPGQSQQHGTATTDRRTVEQQVEGDAAAASAAHRAQPREGIADMDDRCVSEETLQSALIHRQQVASRHRHDGGDPDQGDGMLLDQIEAEGAQAHRHRDAGGHPGRGEQRGDGNGGSLEDVRQPRVDGDDPDADADGDREQAHPGQHQPAPDAAGTMRGDDLRQARRPGGAVDQGQPEEEEATGDPSGQRQPQTRPRGDAARSCADEERLQGQRRQLQADEQQQQILGSDHHHHAQYRAQQQWVKRHAGDPGRVAVLTFSRQRHQDGQAGEAQQHHREVGVEHGGAPRPAVTCPCLGPGRQGDGQDHEPAEQTRVPHVGRAGAARRENRLEQHQGDDEGRQQQLGCREGLSHRHRPPRRCPARRRQASCPPSPVRPPPESPFR